MPIGPQKGQHGGDLRFGLPRKDGLVDQGLSIWGQGFLNEGGRSGYANPGQEIIGAQIPPLRTLAANRERAASDDQVPQAGQWRRVRQREHLGATRNSEPTCIARQPQRDTNTRGERGGSHRERLRAPFRIVGARRQLHDQLLHPTIVPPFAT